MISSLSLGYRQCMMSCDMWKPDCPVGIDRLAIVRCDYVDFSGQHRRDGEIVVLDVVADDVRRIFDELFRMQFPIEKMQSVHLYDGDDEASMADNNTSCFNHRPIEGTDIISLHAYGLAIDLNPLQNPFVVFSEDAGTASIHPPKGWQWLNRHNKKPGMVEDVVELFAEHGFFVWGGRWTTPIDYHHFQVPRALAEILARSNSQDGKLIWETAKKARAYPITNPT